MNRSIRVYIAGPYSSGDQVLNVRTAVMAADALAELGYVPFIPHLSMLWHAISPHEYDFWISQDLEWLPVCDCVLRLPGESAGADQEVRFAEWRELPVFLTIRELHEKMQLEKIGKS